MEWWDKMIVPIRKAWVNVAQHLGIRKTGLVKLRHDVRTCEYEDVRILWELLKKNDAPLRTSTAGGTKKRFCRVVEWAKCAPILLCHQGV